MSRTASFLANAAGGIRDRLARAFPGIYGANAKHDYAKDYGWPEDLTFDHFYRIYTRSGIAAAAVDKTIAKTWSTMPAIWESEQPRESQDEADIRKHFAKRNIWRAFMEADRRSLVGNYAAAILLLRDGKRLDQPVDTVPGGITGLAGVIPAWEGQLTPVAWDEDQFSETYGEPTLYQFDEYAVGPNVSGTRKSQVQIHRDRVLIWSDDGTLNCRSALEPGFNDITDAEKVKGAGGEGFWKNARAALTVESKDGVDIQSIMSGMGFATPEEAKKALDEKVDDFSSGFDKLFMLGGFKVAPLAVSLPQPKEFWEPCVQSFAASFSIPFKVLVGNITGERASTEDANEWSATCMSRRENRVIPILNEFIDRLKRWRILSPGDWSIGWDSLVEASPDDKLARAASMATINSTLGTEPAFLTDEIREAAGFKPGAEVGLPSSDAVDTAEDGPTEVVPSESGGNA